ncbi:hypothetical protein NMY22_g13002 [Coprinellus aureogranulatus]|nr:hypothetical protein NMY22_g13002 [Coprinellus aureogranulatus]
MLLLSLRQAFLFIATLLFVKLTFAYPISAGTTDEWELVERANRPSEQPVHAGNGVIQPWSRHRRDVSEAGGIYTRTPDTLHGLLDIVLEARRNHAIKVSAKAKNDIKAMLPAGHSRQDYKNAKNWHRQQVQGHMNTHGGKKATIVRAAHSGGSNPSEAAHITAKMSNRKGRPIRSTFKDASGKSHRSTSHHVYTKGSPSGAAIPHAP